MAHEADPACAGAAPTGVNDLSPACFVAVFRALGARETARAMCVHPVWAEALRDDTLWRPHLVEVFAQGEARLPGGGDAPSFRAAFLAWCSAFAGLPPGITTRALHMWARVRGWMQEQAPFIAGTLRAGASQDDVRAAEAVLGVTLPPALVAVLRVHDGQALDFDQAFDRFVLWRMQQQRARAPAGPGPDASMPAAPPRWHPSMAWGLFGVYSFYDHVASLRLFSLERIVKWTQALWEHPQALLPRSQLIVGASASLGKLLLLDTATGALRVGSAQDHMPAHPPGPDPGARDGCLLWMEEWAQRLAGGWYQVGDIQVERSKGRGVVLFPVAEPMMAVAVTRGLQVRVSSVFAPEMCGEGGTRYFFSYSVRFQLLAAEQQRGVQGAAQPEQPHSGSQEQQQQEQGTGAEASGSAGASAANGESDGGAPQQQQRAASAAGAGGGCSGWHALQRCQLESRAWRILSEGGDLVNEVEGEGVVGQYPLLEAGGPEFVYQSCTHQAERLGFMEGGFAFVEGTIARPEGPTFTAACPRFELRVPDFIY